MIYLKIMNRRMLMKNIMLRNKVIGNFQAHLKNHLKIIGKRDLHLKNRVNNRRLKRKSRKNEEFKVYILKMRVIYSIDNELLGHDVRF